MTRPSGNLPAWATDALYTSGEDTGLANKLEPTSGEKAQGYHRKFRPPAVKDNWLKNKICQWVSYIADIPYLNFSNYQYIARNGSLGIADLEIISVGLGRTGALCECMWSANLQRWILFGSPTNEAFYYGDSGMFLRRDTATGSAIKYSSGAESGTRLIFIAAGDVGSSALKVDRSAASSVVSWSAVTLPTAAHTHASCDAVVALSNGHLVAVGGRDAVLATWNSTDNGGTWTAHDIGATPTAAYQPLRNASIGASDRVFAWNHDTTANGGNKLYYSDDEGATWTTVSGLGDENIRHVIWVPAFSKYVVTTDLGYGVTDDATNPASYVWTSTSPAVIASAATDGENIVCSIANGSTTYVSMTPDLFTTSITLFTRLLGDSAHICYAGALGGGAFGAKGAGDFRQSMRAGAR